MSESDLMALADAIDEARDAYCNSFGSSANEQAKQNLRNILWDDKGAFAPALRELVALRRLASGARETRGKVIEECARIADPWLGFPTAEPNTYGVKLTNADKAVIEVRQRIAAAIRSLAETGEAVANCGNCRRYRSGTCRFGPPVRLPRRFASEATAESRVRDETLYWGWPTVDVTDWCDEHVATPLRDPTAQTSPLTKGQQIVDDYERDVIAQPCELAQAIDDAIAAVTPAREERLREALTLAHKTLEDVILSVEERVYSGPASELRNVVAEIDAALTDAPRERSPSPTQKGSNDAR